MRKLHRRFKDGRMRALATDETALVRLMADSDFSAVRLFHEGGVPHVVQTHEEWFVPYVT